MARAALNYTQRLRQQRLSYTEPWPAATLADTTATLFRQRWTVPGEKTILEFSVLALDAAHAVVLGELLMDSHGQTGPRDLETNIACLDASVDERVAVLRQEPVKLWQHRQAMFGAREPDE